MKTLKITFYISVSLFIMVACADKPLKETTIEETKVINYKDLNFEDLLAYYLFENSLTDKDSIVVRLNDSIKIYKDYNIVTTESSDSINENIKLGFEKYQDDPYVIYCIKTRNVFNFSFINDDTTLVNGDYIENINSASDSMFNFISHPYDTSYGFNYPEFKRRDLPIFGDTLISKQIFYLNCQFYSDSSVSITNWEKVKEVSMTIKSSYDEVREKASNKLWNKEYDSLNFKQMSAISQLHPVRIFIKPNTMYMRPPPPPPPPPPAPEGGAFDDE